MRGKVRVLLVDLVYDFISSLLYGVGIYTFASRGGFATGGFSGLALMVNHLTALPIGALTLLLNIPVLLLSYHTLGRIFLAKSIKTMVVQTLVIDLLMPLLPYYRGSELLAALFAGVFMGVGLVLVYIRGSSTGGSDFLTLSLHKSAPHITVGQFSLLIDGLILSAGVFVYKNIDAALYGLISTFACSQIVDRILYGAGSGKMALIITTRGMEIADAISRETERGSTLVKAVGTFSGTEKDMLVCACSKGQIFKVRSAAHAIDGGALVMIAELDEVYGEGFKTPEREKKAPPAP